MDRSPDRSPQRGLTSLDSAVPTWLAPTGKGAFRGGDDPYRDLVELPVVPTVPVDLQWLPYSRDGAEVLANLHESTLDAAWRLGFSDSPFAEVPADYTTFQSFLRDLGLTPKIESVLQALALHATNALRSELKLTLPGLLPTLN